MRAIRSEIREESSYYSSFPLILIFFVSILKIFGANSLQKIFEIFSILFANHNSLFLSVVVLTHAFSRGRRDNKFRCARKSSCFAMQARQREDISKHRFRSLEPLDESFHNYPRYLIIINGIDETQAGAASTNPRLKRGKVTRWNARFRNETSSQEVSMR